jgi:hypothetical protein
MVNRVRLSREEAEMVGALNHAKKLVSKVAENPHYKHDSLKMAWYYLGDTINRIYDSNRKIQELKKGLIT